MGPARTLSRLGRRSEPVITPTLETLAARALSWGSSYLRTGRYMYTCMRTHMCMLYAYVYVRCRGYFVRVLFVVVVELIPQREGSHRRQLVVLPEIGDRLQRFHWCGLRLGSGLAGRPPGTLWSAATLPLRGAQIGAPGGGRGAGRHSREGECAR